MLDGTGLDVISTAVVGTSTAKDISALRRRLRVDGDRLSYTVEMAAVGVPLRHHLAAELHRV